MLQQSGVRDLLAVAKAFAASTLESRQFDDLTISQKDSYHQIERPVHRRKRSREDEELYTYARAEPIFLHPYLTFSRSPSILERLIEQSSKKLLNRRGNRCRDEEHAESVTSLN
jgi:hypothetical protein